MVAARSLHYESGLDFEKCRGKYELIDDLKFTTSKIRRVNRDANCQIVIFKVVLQLVTQCKYFLSFPLPVAKYSSKKPRSHPHLSVGIHIY